MESQTADWGDLARELVSREELDAAAHDLLGTLADNVVEALQLHHPDEPDYAAADRDSIRDDLGSAVIDAVTKALQEYDRPVKAVAPSWPDDIAGVLKAAGRNAGVMRLATSLRINLPMTADEAITYMREHVWPHIDQEQNGHEFSPEEFEAIIRAVWREYLGPAAAS